MDTQIHATFLYVYTNENSIAERGIPKDKFSIRIYMIPSRLQRKGINSRLEYESKTKVKHHCQKERVWLASRKALFFNIETRKVEGSEELRKFDEYVHTENGWACPPRDSALVQSLR